MNTVRVVSAEDGEEENPVYQSKDELTAAVGRTPGRQGLTLTQQWLAIPLPPSLGPDPAPPPGISSDNRKNAQPPVYISTRLSGRTLVNSRDCPSVSQSGMYASGLEGATLVRSREWTPVSQSRSYDYGKRLRRVL